MQCASDLAAHLIAEQEWAPAATTGEQFDRLAEQAWFPRALRRSCERLVGFRNAVAHGYAHVRTRLLHLAATTGLDDLILFSQHLAPVRSQHP